MNLNAFLFLFLKISHLDGTILLSDGVALEALVRPSLLITGALNAEIPSRDRYTAMFGNIRNNNNTYLFYFIINEFIFLLDTINSTLTKGGSVLLPSDSAARVLELCY